MKNQIFLITIFCLIPNIFFPMDDKQSDSRSAESIPVTLSLENEKALLSFVKKQLVQQGAFPENVDLCLKEFNLDKGHQDSKLGQRYDVRVVAKWFTYNLVQSEPGIHVLKTEQHGCDLFSHMFDSGLIAAGVQLGQEH